MVLYGIKSCDTCRKALKALQEAGHTVQFRDIRAAPLDVAEIARFHATFGERLINRASTTWRGLAEAERAGPPDALLAAHPTLMKRPVIDRDGRLTLGWGKDVQAVYLA
ncbi:MAG: ArsC/Spx/MgsR family protein [Albidovulum sp.]|uniref:arsenate reductase family protein n=1 Tax=Albidovulum sp. TaxID=1872424 RepID=UPI003C8CA8DD